MNRWILDASALLTLLNQELGSAVVAEALERDECCISTVNIAEVVTWLAQKSVPEAEARYVLRKLNLATVEFGFDAACRCGALRPATQALGLSLGDRACLATAQPEKIPVLTADRAWANLDLGLDIHIIR